MSGEARRWNERYAAALADGVPDRPPAQWLQANAGLIEVQSRGIALDVACGLGSNALHLAELGFAVDAVDISDVAIAELDRRARSRGVTVRAQQADLTTDPLPGDGYQVIVCTYFMERQLFAPLARALAPGGLLLYETFADGGRWGLEPGELRGSFPQLAEVVYREGAVGGRATASLVAQAPAGLPSEEP